MIFIQVFFLAPSSLTWFHPRCIAPANWSSEWEGRCRLSAQNLQLSTPPPPWNYYVTMGTSQSLTSFLLDQILKRSCLWWGMAAGLGVTVLPMIWLRLQTFLPNPELFCNIVLLWIKKELFVMKLRRLLTESIRSEAGRVFQKATFPFWYGTVKPSVVIWICSTWGSIVFNYLWTD